MFLFYPECHPVTPSTTSHILTMTKDKKRRKSLEQKSTVLFCCCVIALFFCVTVLYCLIVVLHDFVVESVNGVVLGFFLFFCHCAFGPLCCRVIVLLYWLET